MMSEKVVGYLLLFLGLGVILLAGFNVWQIFTKKIKPVQIFNFSGISINSGQTTTMAGGIDTTGLTAEEVGLLQEMIKQETAKTPLKMEVIPGDTLNQTTNLFAHVILMGFVASIGYKIAGLGVLMLRPIVVKLKEQKTWPEEKVN